MKFYKDRKEDIGSSDVAALALIQCGITWLDIRMSFIVCSIKQILKSKPIQVYLQKRLCSENEERGAA